MMDQKPRITIDMSKWDMGYWGEDIAKCLAEGLTIEKQEYGIAIEMRFSEAFETAARKIAKEAIESFLNPNSAVSVDLTSKGIEIGDYEGAQTENLIIPWAQIWLGSLNDVKTIQAWLNEQIADLTPPPSS